MSLNAKLTVKNVYDVLNYLKAEPKIESSGNISCMTVCHHGAGRGTSRKLIYYSNSKLFVCYTQCEEEHFGIIKLVEKAMHVSYYEAVCIIENITGVSSEHISSKEGFDDEDEIETEVINEDLLYIKEYTKREEDYTLIKYDKKLLNSFYPLYHISFLKDNISIEAMKKFNVLFDVEKNRIIIPHFHHEDNSLIAIRCRNLNEDLVEMGLKYTPIKMLIPSKNIPENGKKCKKLVKKPIVNKTSAYLYGLGRAAEAIKSNKIVFLFESEKSVMQMETYFGDRNCSVATMGSSLSERHIQLLLEHGVEEVVIAYDKEYEVYGDKEDKLYRKKLRKRLIDKLLPHFKVSVIYDRQGLLDYKDSPSDKGKKTFLKLFKSRFYIKG